MARRAFMAQAEDRWPLVGRKRIARLMRAAGIAGVSRRRSAPITTRQAAGDRPSSRQRSRPPRLHGRAAERVVGGRHHLPADVGRLSLSRGRSRRLVASDRRMGLLGRSEDPRRARRSRHGARGPKAQQRRPSLGSWFAIHVGRFRRSLQGSRRSSIDRLGRRRLRHAMCESFFATLERELIDRRRFRSHSEARMAVFQFIEGFYKSLTPPLGPGLALAHRTRKEA